MALRFHKMHGLGNDFVVVDARREAVAIDGPRARAIADRHEGIGCDQVILLEPSGRADAAMRIWNADGGEAEACGNASRCVALLLGTPATVETAGGMLRLEADGAEPSVDMGEPRFGWDQVPLAYPLDTARLPVAWEDLAYPAALSVGNPHVVFFVADVDEVPLDRLGPLIEHDPLFPERVNVGVAAVTGANALDLRVWERGAGLTRACGTGACAAAVAAIRRGLVASPVAVALPGGTLRIAWAPGGDIAMSGPATHVFTGEAQGL